MVIDFLDILFRIIVGGFVSYYVGRGCTFLSRSGRERRKEARLRQKGDIVTGHITRHLFKFNLKDTPCVLAYSYEYEGKSYKNTQIVHPADFNHFTDGDAVAVRFCMLIQKYLY